MGNTWRWRFLLGTALLAAAVLIGGMPVADAAPWVDDPLDPPPIVEDGESEYQAPANGFDWRAPSRFGRDDNGDGITDYHWNDLQRPPEHDGAPETYEADWVHPASFPIEFDACPTEGEAAKSDAGTPTDNTYTWQINGRSYGGRDCRLVGGEVTFPAEGVYPASLTISRPDGTTAGPYLQDVTVRDFLIVSMGDSYGSGEGNPDIAQDLNDPGLVVTRPAQWVDKRCHRSAHAGAAQTARRIEGSDPKTTVTFLSFACSGATFNTVWGTDPLFPYAPAKAEDVACIGVKADCPNVGTGILGPYKGPEPPPGAGYLPPQIDQLKTALTNPRDGSLRTVDSLVVSGGGNDAGFGPAATVCVLVLENCQDAWVNPQGAGDNIRLDQRFAQDAAALSGKYDQFDQALDASGIPIARTYVTEYPGPTTGDGGVACPAILDDVLHPNLLAGTMLGGLLVAVFGPAILVTLSVLGPLAILWSQTRAMAGDEVVWAGNTIAPSINTQLKSAAERHRWTYVDGIGEPYVGHGYCASDPYIRTASDASRVQGPFGILELSGINKDTKGTLHPNVLGHQMYANQLVPLIAEQLAQPNGSAQFTVVEGVGGSESRRGRGGWLTGRCQTGSGACTSDAAVVTVEAYDPYGLKGADFTVDGRRGCPAGLVCTAQSIDAFTYRWTFTIALDGIRRLGFSVSNRFGYLSDFGREVKVDLHDPTAAATLETPTAPTGVRFDGHDGRGSGVDQVRFEGLWHGNSPGSTAPGQTVAVDLGGTYALRFRATDEAGRSGPWQTQTLTLGGPTMAGTPDEPRSGALAETRQGCTQSPDPATHDDNGISGLGVASHTDRTHGNAVPYRRALAVRAHAERAVPGLGNGNEDCASRATLANIPLKVGAGTSGLAPGEPVTLQATIRLPGVMSVTPARQPDFVSNAELSAGFHISGPVSPTPEDCDEENCDPPDAVRFSADLRQYVSAPAGPLNELFGFVDYSSSIRSNREPEKWNEFYDEYSGGCAWPCSSSGHTRHLLEPFKLPDQEFTITFDSHVGARHSIASDIDVFTQAYALAGRDGPADADFSSVIDIQPVVGFEGLDLTYSNAQPNLAPDAGDDAGTVVGSTQTTVDVLANDTDPDSDTLTVTEVSPPAHGTATIEVDGRITYKPGVSFAGRDSFTYTVSDGRGSTDTATVRIRRAGITTPPADFDGDGDSDLAVYRPSNGTWLANGGLVEHWGVSGDIAVPGDYDGDGTTDVAVFRPSNGIWFVKDGPTLAWGTAGDIPVPGDYDGDGTTDVAVYRPSLGVWFVEGGAISHWGTAGDVPVPGDYDGDGTTDLAVYRPGLGIWFVQGGTPEVTVYGAGCETPSAPGACDVPVPADYDGDGATDKAVFRQSSGLWFVSGGSPGVLAYGASGDVPVPGDFNADGRADKAVFRPSVGVWFVPGVTPEITAWGTAGDDVLPLASSVRSAYFPPG